MNTPAHVLVAAALLARPGARGRNGAAVAGSLVPDVMIYGMVAWERVVNGYSFEAIFRERYFAPEWDTFFAVPNSIPLYLAGIAAGLMLRVELLWVFCAAAFAHVILDLPLHHDDGHSHFWPFTDWVFASPVSYWDPAHHGTWVGVAEMGLCAVLAVVLWRRFAGVPAKALIGFVLALEVGVPVLWLLTLAVS